MEFELSYKPLTGRIDERDFDMYLMQPGAGDIAKKAVIAPFEEAVKAEGAKTWTFGDFKVKSSAQSRSNTSWERVFSSLKEFLRVRAEDSRDYDMEGLKAFDGIGYCILIPDLRKAVETRTKEHTSKSEFFQLYWPRRKEQDTYPSGISIPDRDYRKINDENARIVKQAKGFCAGLDELVTKTFKNSNQQWFEAETGYSLGKLPAEATKRARKVARGKYVFINLVPEEAPQYGDAIIHLMDEMQELEQGNSVEGYRTRQTGEGTYVNIKNLLQRLEIDSLKKANLVTLKGRYEICP